MAGSGGHGDGNKALSTSFSGLSVGSDDAGMSPRMSGGSSMSGAALGRDADALRMPATTTATITRGAVAVGEGLLRDGSGVSSSCSCSGSSSCSCSGSCSGSHANCRSNPWGGPLAESVDQAAPTTHVQGMQGSDGPS